MNLTLPSYLPSFFTDYWPVWVLVLLWSLFWKGWALWTAAKRDAKIWFVVFLVVNTVGILEIAYIYFFSKRKGVSAPQ